MAKTSRKKAVKSAKKSASRKQRTVSKSKSAKGLPANHPLQKAAFKTTFDILTARANSCGMAPSTLRRVQGKWIICFLQDDCSYAECRPYTGPIPPKTS